VCDSPLIGVAVCSGLTDLRHGPYLAKALNVTSLVFITAGVIAVYCPAAAAYLTRRHR
jgi:hypothetical protein